MRLQWRYPAGDLNQDGSQDILDIVLMVNHILNITELDDYQICIGDLNLDDVIDVLDVISLMNIILEN